jgi:hypothetical protein
MSMRLARRLPLAVVAAAGLVACATAPIGPSVMVLPGRHASFDQFATDDGACRQWADQQIGIAPQHAGQAAAAEGAIAGTAIGAAAGAAIGAAVGQPATGAAIGAGSGLLGGSLYGGSAAGWAHADAQQRYDGAYMQCMYGHGHQIPVAAGMEPYSAYSANSSRNQYPELYENRRNVPAPPRGAPPSPPPDVR